MKIQAWLNRAEEEEAYLPVFLGLSRNPYQPSRWLVDEPSDLNDLQGLACMRHLVAHGTLSPTKALQWGLKDVYCSALQLLRQWAERPTISITPKR